MEEKKYMPTMWNDAELMKATVATATSLSRSDLLPETYKNKPANCVIAIDIANRTGLPPLNVAQQLYVVQGKPAWSGQMAITLIELSGRFSEVDWEWVGEEGKDSFGCYAYATRLSNGKVCKGDTVTIAMAKAEGWYGKNGSKWKTMPRQMLMYRSASFFARVYCPSALMGLQTTDEIEDITPNAPKTTTNQPKETIDVIDLTTPKNDNVEIKEEVVVEEQAPVYNYEEKIKQAQQEIAKEVVVEQPTTEVYVEPVVVETPVVENQTETNDIFVNEVVEPTPTPKVENKDCCVKCGTPLQDWHLRFYEKYPNKERLCFDCTQKKGAK